MNFQDLPVLYKINSFLIMDIISHFVIYITEIIVNII